MRTNPVKVDKFEHEIECGDGDCGCGILKITYWDVQEDNDIFLSYYARAFDSTSIKEKILNRVKMAWSILTGKEYLLYDINLNSKSQIKKFKEFVTNIDESKAFYD